MILAVISIFSSCKKEEESNISVNNPVHTSAIAQQFGDRIDPYDPFDYANQSIPNYIARDNTDQNHISNEGASLGRVLFYDQALSIDNTISCSSCHRQEHGFGDLADASIGVNGVTGRHSMRLINGRFSEENTFFWYERATSLEEQSTMPVQDHVEMGFSGEEGNPDIQGLLEKLSEIDYYPELFEWVYGDAEITEERIQLALAQFIRSIQSFDSRFDEGRASANNDLQPFANFTPEENMGKQLFITPPQFNANGERIGGGLGCGGCHRPPEFDIDPNSLHNGIVGTLDGQGLDFDVTRSPTLRDLFDASGNLNGPLMHSALSDLNIVINHYNTITEQPGIDPRLMPNGQAQRLMITPAERTALTDFLKTLSGQNVYVAEQWSDPF